jgi:type II secretory pathway predicted ATPase ExeA/predicted  nucleic acid-binding Zn-ribbon protein
MLRYGILESKGFIVIIGEPGTGKSTLLNATAANFGSSIRFAKITDPALEEMDFFNFVANAFEMGKTFQSKAEFLIRLGEFVKDAGAHSKKVILVIDEAQRLTPDMLEQIRVFSNIETPGQKVISCIFAGQTEFLDMVNQNRALAQRVFFSHIIQPLTQSETADYIAHRLKVSGTEEPIFTSAAVQEVFRLSGGNPRLINILCDQALLSGYASDTKTIGPELIKGSIENTLIPLNTKKEPAAEAKKQEPAKPSTTTAPTAGNTTGPSPIAPEKTGLRTSARKTAYWAPIALIAILGLSAYFYLMESAGSEQAKLKVELDTFRKENTRLQAQLVEINNQKGAAEAQLGEVTKQNAGLAADTQELKSAQDRVAQFKATVSERDKKLIQLEQKFEELEKVLAKEKAEKDQLGTELSTRQAAIADLQKRLEAAGSEQLKLESDIQNAQRENARLQSQLQEMTANKTEPPPMPSPAKASAKSQPPPVSPDTAGAAPDPAGVIDFIIKRKTQ